MPLFFFHLRTPRGLDRDDAGTTFPGLDEAYLDVCRAIPDMVGDLLRDGHDPLRCTFEIADDRGRLVMDVPFAERLVKTAARPPRGPNRAPNRAAALAPGLGGTADDLLARAAAAAAEARALRRSIRDTVSAFERTAMRPDASFMDIIARVYALPMAVAGEEAAPALTAPHAGGTEGGPAG